MHMNMIFKIATEAGKHEEYTHTLTQCMGVKVNKEPLKRVLADPMSSFTKLVWPFSSKHKGAKVHVPH